MIPDSALEKHLGILGINGSGKTYTAKGLVERLLDKEARVCIIDPTGVWWGLKSSSNGKRGAYKIVVFGGEHADLQIGGSHGEAIAEAIGTSNTPAIIDTSLMRGSERTKFFTDFAETLRIKNSGPLHLFIDEAHLFCPQGRVSDPHSAQMLHAANNLISLGRARGLRVTLISQRPAKMHKDSLTQVHSLIAMRLIAPQDRGAVEDWIADQADSVKGKEIIASLPQLKTGEGYLWAPELGILERMKFPQIKTFDSSKSPDDHGKGKGPVLSPIDLTTIQGRLESVKTEALANDPAKLKGKIRELEKMLSQQKPQAPIVDSQACLRSAQAAYDEALCDLSAAFSMVKAGKNLKKFIAPRMVESKAVTIKRGDLVKAPKYEAVITHISDGSSGDEPLTGPQKRILKSLSMWKAMGFEAPTKAQVACAAGYSPEGGAFGNPIGQLRMRGLIDYPSPGVMSLKTNIEPISNVEARDAIYGILTGPERKILNAFDGISTEPVLRAYLAERAGYSPRGGAFGNPAGHLCTLKILEKSGSGFLALSSWARELLT